MKRHPLCLIAGHTWREPYGIVHRHCGRCGFTPRSPGRDAATNPSDDEKER